MKLLNGVRESFDNAIRYIKRAREFSKINKDEIVDKAVREAIKSYTPEKIQEALESANKEYLAKRLQDARDIVKYTGEDPSECIDLVIVVFNRFIEHDEIVVLMESLREIRDKL